MELVELIVLVPKGNEQAIAAMVQSQTEAFVRAETGTERSDLLEARLVIARTTEKSVTLPADEAEAVAVLEAAVAAVVVTEPDKPGT